MTTMSQLLGEVIAEVCGLGPRQFSVMLGVDRQFIYSALANSRSHSLYDIDNMIYLRTGVRMMHLPPDLDLKCDSMRSYAARMIAQRAKRDRAVEQMRDAFFMSALAVEDSAGFVPFSRSREFASRAARNHHSRSLPEREYDATAPP